VAEEFLPFLISGGAVFLAGAGRTAAGDEGAVAVDDLLWIDRLVTHRGVDVAVADHELGDVGRHAVHDRVGDEQAPEIVWCELQRLVADVGQASAGEGFIKQCSDAGDRNRPVLHPSRALE
jgi:hypothetical protein